MTSENFVHLHVHTEYSMLDGAARVPDLMQEVARQGMPAIAMTDHGNVFGAYEFYKQAKKAGVKPIIGIEAYVAPESRFDKKRVQWASGGEDDVSGGGAYTHMTIWLRIMLVSAISFVYLLLHPLRAITTSPAWIENF